MGTPIAIISGEPCRSPNFSTSPPGTPSGLHGHLSKVAGNQPFKLHFEGRRGITANVLRKPAAVMEGTAGRRVERRRQFTGQLDAFAAKFGVDGWCRAQQCLGVRV